MEMKVSKIAEMTGHAGPIYNLCLGRDTSSMLTASSDRFVAEWNLKENAASPFSVKMEEAVFTVHHIPESAHLLIGTISGNLHVIDLAAKQEVRNLKTHQKGLFSIVHSPAHSMVITAGGDGSLSVWDATNFEHLRHFFVSEQKIRSANIVADELITCGMDGSLRFFDLPWLNELRTIDAHEGGANVIQKHPTKPLLISGGKDGMIKFWHQDDFRLVREIPAHNFGIYDIQFNQPSSGFPLLAVTASRDKTVKVWDAETFEKPIRIERPSFSSHTHSVNRVLWLNESEFISAGDDRRIMRWQVSATS